MVSQVAYSTLPTALVRLRRLRRPGLASVSRRVQPSFAPFVSVLLAVMVAIAWALACARLTCAIPGSHWTGRGRIQRGKPTFPDADFAGILPVEG